MSGRIFTNASALTYTSSPSKALTSDTVYKFHKSLPTYNGPTPLIPLPALITAPRLDNVYLKDESLRFINLPSFKPLGISWATRNGIIAELSELEDSSIPEDISLGDLGARAKEGSIKLIAASDGKLGLIVAQLGKLFEVGGTDVRIFMPENTPGEVKEKVRKEGVEVIEIAGDIEDAMREACLHAVAVDGILISIDAVENYEDIPRWIVEGYSTIFKEVDEQLGGRGPDLIVVPVGIGGLAQAAVTHYRTSPSSRTRILAVEPESSAALFASLEQGRLVTMEAKQKGRETIMEHLNYGTVAKRAWEVLKQGLDASTVVRDEEVEQAMGDLRKGGIEAGPCGAAVLAGLRNLVEGGEGIWGLKDDSVVVLVGTDSVQK